MRQPISQCPPYLRVMSNLSSTVAEVRLSVCIVEPLVSPWFYCIAHPGSGGARRSCEVLSTPWTVFWNTDIQLKYRGSKIANDLTLTRTTMLVSTSVRPATSSCSGWRTPFHFLHVGRCRWNSWAVFIVFIDNCFFNWSLRSVKLSGNIYDYRTENEEYSNIYRHFCNEYLLARKEIVFIKPVVKLLIRRSHQSYLRSQMLIEPWIWQIYTILFNGPTKESRRFSQKYCIYISVIWSIEAA